MTLERLRELHTETVAAHQEARRRHLDHWQAAFWKRLKSLRKVWERTERNETRRKAG